MKNRLRQKIEYCGLDYKSEVKKLIFINLLFSVLTAIVYLLTREHNYCIYLILFDLIVDYLFLSNYGTKAKAIDEERENEFVTAISYFEIFIENRNNVYQSFNKVIQYTSEWMKEAISSLLVDIDKDKSVQPFVNFAKKFKIKIATNIMLSIYSMVDQGESFEQIKQFQLIFDELLKSKQLENAEKKKRSLSILASLPLVGAALITIVLTVGVISIIGDLVNVI